MIRSEIFEEYARIAREQGLISEAAEDPRRGSDDISTIEALYGIKPNGKDEKSLTEQAHPESVIIAPSYDRVNGLVENDQERQNIMVGICNKPHQAKLTQHRYAQTREDLANELVRLGFYLESTDNSDLMSLADHCSDKITKIALIPALLLGAASLVGVLAVYNNFGEVSQGVRADCQKVQDKLQEMISSDEYDAHDDALTFMLKNIQFILNICDAIEDARGEIPEATLNGASAMAVEQSEKSKKLEKILNHFTKNCRILSNEIPQYIRLISTYEDKLNDNQESNWWAAAKKAYRLLDPNDAADLIAAFESLAKSLSDAPKMVDALRTQRTEEAKLLQKKLIADQQDEEIESKMPSMTSSPNTEKDSEKELNELEKLTDLQKPAV